MRQALLAISVFALVDLTACSVIPKAPETKPPIVSTPAAELSTLEARANVPNNVLTNAVNNAVPDQLFWITGERINDCPVTECSYQIRVLRNGPITVGHNGRGQVVLTMPIRTADGRVDVMKNVFGARIREHADFNAAVTGTVAMGFGLQPNWTIISSPQLSFHVEVAEVRVTVAGIPVTISMRGKLRDLLNGQRASLENKIAEALRGKLDFKKAAADVWAKLHTVQQISGQPPIWLLVDPVAIKAENPKADNTGLYLAMGVDAYLATHIQQDPPPTPSAEALPNLQVVPAVKGRYKLATPIRVSVEEVNKQLTPLIGKDFEFEAGDKKITAKLVQGRLYTNGPDLVAYAKVKKQGFFPLWVGAYLNGTPQYDTANTLVYLDPFDFDVATNVLLLDKAEWFFHGKIREALQQAARYNIGDELAKLRQMLADKLNSINLGDHVILHGTVDTLKPLSIYTTQDMLNVEALAEGSLNVEAR